MQQGHPHHRVCFLCSHRTTNCINKIVRMKCEQEIGKDNKDEYLNAIDFFIKHSNGIGFLT